MTKPPRRSDAHGSRDGLFTRGNRAHGDDMIAVRGVAHTKEEADGEGGQQRGGHSRKIVELFGA
jgi:hypothetical protein